MPVYRKKPVEVECRQFVSGEPLHCAEALARWCGGSTRGIALPSDQIEIEIPTREGDMRASVGDWIIKGVKGEFYPCKPDIFEQTYDLVLPE